MIFYILSVKHFNKIASRVSWKICCWYLVVTFLWFFIRVISVTLQKKHRQGVQKQRRIIKCITYFGCSSLWLPSWELKVLKCQNPTLHNLKENTSLYCCDNTIKKWVSCTISPVVYNSWVPCRSTCGNIQSKGILSCKIVNNQLLCTYTYKSTMWNYVLY